LLERKKVHEHKVGIATDIKFGVVTVSDSRFLKKIEDISGSYIKKRVKEAGYKVVYYRIVPDEIASIRKAFEEGITICDCMVFTGGTGISKRDVTLEALNCYFEKELPGFGELFRMLSYKEVGSISMLSRACAGTIKDKAVFLLPGSPNSVELAVNSLILPEIPHILKMLRS